jgi:hypothetical protein
VPLNRRILILLLIIAAMPLAGSATESPHAEAALAMITVPWQQLNYSLTFMGPRRGYRAMTFPDERRIEIYLRPGDSPRLVAYDIAHELGHAIDLTFNTRARRQKWMQVRGIDPSLAWFGCDACSDFKTPAGDFAETFAFLLLGPGHYASKLAPPPSSEQIQAISSFFPKNFLPALAK